MYLGPQVTYYRRKSNELFIYFRYHCFEVYGPFHGKQKLSSNSYLYKVNFFNKNNDRNRYLNLKKLLKICTDSYNS